MIVWTPAVLGVLFTCVLYFCICPCSAQLSMFHAERRSRITLIINIITTFRRQATLTTFACEMGDEPRWGVSIRIPAGAAFPSSFG